MMNVLNTVLNSAGAALIIFTVAASLASVAVRSPVIRAAAGVAVLTLTLIVPISTRSLFEWTVSTVERPSFPGFLLLATLALSAVVGWRLAPREEFRFATAVIAIAGIVLYPAALGFLNSDPYVVGYDGFLLPTVVALVMAYALWRGYLLTVLTLNIAVAAFLLGAGASRNLWDYVMDPIAWIISCGTWIALAATAAFWNREKTADVTTLVQPSSGIGETPISH